MPHPMCGASSSDGPAAIPSDADLGKLEAEVERAHLVLAAARRRKNLSSPTYKLPNEVLSLIFEECFRTQKSTRRRTNCIPLNVASVSAHWRDVALSCPIIWTRIDLFFQERAPYKAKGAPFKALGDVLLRSKSLPIDVEVHDLSSHRDEEDDHLFTWSIETLSEHMYRCRTFTFHVESAAGIQCRFYDFDVAMPILEELSLLHDGDPLNVQGHYSLPSHLPILEHSLKSLTLSHIGLYLDDSQALLEGLRSLKLCDAFIKNKIPNENILHASYVQNSLDLRVIAKARDLEDLEIWCLRDLDEADAPFVAQGDTAEVELPKLKTLSMTMWPSADALYDFIYCLSAPALQKLSITRGRSNVRITENDSLVVDLGAVPVLFNNSNPTWSLQELAVEGCAFYPNNLPHIISHTPHLTSLRLASCTVGDALFAALTELTHDGQPKFCPGLKFLDLQDVRDEADFPQDYEPFSTHSLLIMLQTRYNAGVKHAHKLIDLWISADHGLTDDESRTFAPYVERIHYHD